MLPWGQTALTWALHGHRVLPLQALDTATVPPQLPPWPLCPWEGTGTVTGTHFGSAQENPAASGIAENQPGRILRDKPHTEEQRFHILPVHICLVFNNCSPVETEKQHPQIHPIPEVLEVGKKQICKKLIFISLLLLDFSPNWTETSRIVLNLSLSRNSPGFAAAPKKPLQLP